MHGGIVAGAGNEPHSGYLLLLGEAFFMLWTTFSRVQEHGVPEPLSSRLGMASTIFFCVCVDLLAAFLPT